MSRNSAAWQATFGWLCRVLLVALLATPLGFVPRVAQAALSCQGANDVIVSGSLSSGTTTWSTGNIYCVEGDVTVPGGATLLIQGGAIVKADLGTTLNVYGTLSLTGTVGLPVSFTSLKDDTLGGDTNGDGTGTTPNRGDWQGVDLYSGSTLSGNALMRYAMFGLEVYQTGVTTIAPTITGWTFEKNYYGLTLALAGDGNISSLIQNNTFQQNYMGLYVNSDGSHSGGAFPTLTNNTFSNQVTLPIYLHGTAWPTYSGTSNTFSGDGYHAIGVGGSFSQSVTLPQVNGGVDTTNLAFPYAVLDDWTINAGMTVTMPLGTVVKAWGVYINFIGNLVLQGTSNSPIVFTSFGDDSAGGDANGDGATTQPAPGDWSTIYLQDSRTNFTNVILRYSDLGAQVYNASSGGIWPSITHDVFQYNKTASIYLNTPVTNFGSITSTISNNQVTGGKYGLAEQNLGVLISPTVTNNTFTQTSSGMYFFNMDGVVAGTYANNQLSQNDTGVTLHASGAGDLAPTLSGNTFYNNTDGLVANNLVTRNPSTGAVQSVVSGASRPILTGNTFNQQGAYPIYLDATAFPTYSGNTFSGDHFRAIALGGYFAGSGGTWPIVGGDNGQPFPYVVDTNAVIWSSNTSVTLQPGAVVKFKPGTAFTSFGSFQFSGATFQKTVLTSAADDSILGDTLGDGATTGAKKDWDAVYLVADGNTVPNLSNVDVRYSTFGIALDTYLPDNTNNCMTVSNSSFSQNEYGVSLVASLSPDNNSCPSVVSSSFKQNTFGVGLSVWSEGNIVSVITDSTFISNTYGVFVTSRDWSITVNAPTQPQTSTIPKGRPAGLELPAISVARAQSQSKLQTPASTTIPPATGVVIPSIKNNRFQGNYFPFYVGGTGYPVYAGNVFTGNIHPAIRLGGTFDNSRLLNDTFTMPLVDGGFGQKLPYAITNDVTPCTTDGHCVSAAMTVQFDSAQSRGATVGVLPNTVFKIDSNLYINVYGELDLQSSTGSPVIFTSYRDDTVGGDTNADGGATVPARGDWTAVYLQSSGVRFTYQFDNAIVKYASQGVYVWDSGTNNIFPVVANDTFVENTVGLSFKTWATGNIIDPQDVHGNSLGPLVHDNYFANNTEHVHVETPAASGIVNVSLANNCWLPTTTYGVNNLSGLNVVNAAQNWWAAASGPQYNANGSLGVTVSSHVTFAQWLPSPAPACQSNTLYGIQGRVANSGDTPLDPQPLPGVTLVLNGSTLATSNPNGAFTFGSLPAGQYVVQPILNNYIFSPTTWTVDLPPNAIGLAFVAAPVTGQTYQIQGQVLDRQNHPVSGVTVTALSSGTQGVATTDGAGNYTVTGLLQGNYSLTPLLTGYLFSPPSRNMPVSGNVTGQNFVRRNLGETNAYIYLPLVRR